MVIECANCRAQGRPAFTLAAYPSGEGDAVLVDFCSSGCLEEWTSNRRADDRPDERPGDRAADRPDVRSSRSPAGVASSQSR